MTQYEKEAVNCVITMYRENGWPFRYCVGKVSQSYKLDFGYLLGMCGKETGRRKREAKLRVTEANKKESVQLDLFRRIA